MNKSQQKTLRMLTDSQKIMFVEGFNLKVENWNSDISDKGKTPIKGWAAREGYECAREEIVRRQVDGQKDIIMKPITIEDVDRKYRR